MRKAFVVNGRIVLPDGTNDATLVLENGKIADNDYRGEIPSDAVMIDAEGMYVTPGFVEIHAHGGDGCDFMDATAEAFDRIASIHLLHGTTSIMPTTVACDEAAMSRVFDAYREASSGKSKVSFLGLHLEGPFISQGMRGAQNPAVVREPSKREVDRIIDEAGDIIGLCTAAPEIGGIEYMAKRMSEHGIALSAGHSEAVCADILRAYDMGFRHITHMYCSTPSVRKINQVICAGVREAAYLIDDMAIELIGDGHHVAREVLQLALKFKGADKINLTTDSMRAAGTNVSESYMGAVKPENRVIIEEGVAKLPDRTSFAGSIATSDIALKWAVNDCGVSICDAVKMLSLSPAKVVGADDRKGSLEKGKDADILFVDDKMNVRRVMTAK